MEIKVSVRDPEVVLVVPVVRYAWCGQSTPLESSPWVDGTRVRVMVAPPDRVFLTLTVTQSGSVVRSDFSVAVRVLNWVTSTVL